MQNENKRRFVDGCFSGEWSDADVTKRAPSYNQPKYERKSLETLLEELEEIKQYIESLAEKELFLENLMRINRGEYSET